jgi:hypothetical protein
MRFFKSFLLSLMAIWPQWSSAETYGAWSVDVTNDGEAIYAATVNDSGNLLGQYCFPAEGNCIWLVGMSSACDEGDKYPVLANADTGASHISVYCSTQLKDGLYRYVFSEFDEIDAIVKNAMRVGFAVPLQDDRFKVVRFDLNGSNEAIALLRAAAEKAKEDSSSDRKSSKNPKTTKDQSL